MTRSRLQPPPPPPGYCEPAAPTTALDTNRLPPLSAPDVYRALGAMYDIADIRTWNTNAAAFLAARILPHTVADLTVRELIDLQTDAQADFTAWWQANHKELA